MRTSPGTHTSWQEEQPKSWILSILQKQTEALDSSFRHFFHLLQVRVCLCSVHDQNDCQKQIDHSFARTRRIFSAGAGRGWECFRVLALHLKEHQWLLPLILVSLCRKCCKGKNFHWINDLMCGDWDYRTTCKVKEGKNWDWNYMVKQLVKFPVIL